MDGSNLSVVGHQDSECNPKRKTIWVTLLSDPCAIHLISKSVIYELAVNWEICKVFKSTNKITCVVWQVM